MDTFDEAFEYESMDHSVVNQQFVDDLIAGGSVGPQVIDLGCGPAAIAILLAQQNPEFQVIGIDSSVEMLELAKREIDMGNVIDRVFLEHSDAKDMHEYADDLADTVISNSLVHHLADSTSALQGAVRILRPGGRLFVRDLARPDSEADVERLVAQYSGGESEFAQQLFRQSLHASLTLAEVQELVGGLGISGNHVQMSSDRHWTIDWASPAES